jgi:ribosomal protein S18
MATTSKVVRNDWRRQVVTRRVTGLTTHRQHNVATAITNVREMALLPYLGRRA